MSFVPVPGEQPLQRCGRERENMGHGVSRALGTVQSSAVGGARGTEAVEVGQPDHPGP